MENENKPSEEYETYGAAWEKEVGKLSKAEIIAMAKRIGKDKEQRDERVNELEMALLIYINADRNSPHQTSILTHQQQHKINLVSLEILK